MNIRLHCGDLIARTIRFAQESLTDIAVNTRHITTMLKPSDQGVTALKLVARGRIEPPKGGFSEQKINYFLPRKSI